ncbi:histidine triad (HIT) family protein [Fluviicoccus keumensis]|uniref:Histidine triad (HIT) family protein n=1 Tax=Fluviicoccus keumensis TaxID=1435465 RepID=A0A4Q7YNZ1_9GAMM|nr:HIT family protein [Fluviicoccus keumensis]RZU38409.1 histidine triad (HIT) family protein [Fluviicoccus keumensis]
MKNCIFCAIAAREAEASLVYEDALCLAFMDLFPMRPGHILVVNKRHAQFVHQLTAAERAHLLETGSRIGQALRATSLKPSALHFNINDGKAAHQTVPHVHLHVLPRYDGDVLAFVGGIFGKPVQLLRGGTRREQLERQASEVREALRRLPE